MADGLYLSYRLQDVAGNMLELRVVKLAPVAYKGLQLMASRDDPLQKANALPYKLDGKTGLYVIATTAQEGISKTRALRLKKDGQEYQATAKLMFTTLAKHQ